MSRGEDIRTRVNRGESVINREGGNSMTPILRSREPVVLRAPWRPLEKGDIVFCKVRGRYMTHMVHAVGSDGRYLIGNNHGHMNGWTRDIIAIALLLPRNGEWCGPCINEGRGPDCDRRAGHA